MTKIAIINGPNLNLTGLREPEIYGNKTFDEFIPELRAQFPNAELIYFQSNVEGELINHLHACRTNGVEGIVLNAGAYTHTSLAIADAVAAIAIPTVEVHISNIFNREAFRKNSFLAEKCVGSICGLGLRGYELALRYFLNNL